MVTNTQGKGLIIKTWLKYFHEHGMTVKKLAKDKFQGFKKKKPQPNNKKPKQTYFSLGFFCCYCFLFGWFCFEGDGSVLRYLYFYIIQKSEQRLTDSTRNLLQTKEEKKKKAKTMNFCS